MDKQRVMSNILIDEIKETGEVPYKYIFKNRDFNGFRDPDVDDKRMFINDLVGELFGTHKEYEDEESITEFQYRNRYTQEISWCLVSESWIEALAKMIKGTNCLEIYGGLGLISHRLRENDVDIICTDNKSFEVMDFTRSFTEVEDMSALDAIRAFEKDTLDYIIASWIPNGDNTCERIARLVSEKQKNCKIIYIGEESGGCTATDTFLSAYNELTYQKGYKTKMNKIMKGFQSWYGINDRIMLLQPRK